MKKRAFGGMLLILCFTFALVQAYVYLVVDGLWENASSGSGMAGFAMLAVFGTVVTVGLGMIALVGGLSALFGSSFAISIIGAACGALSMGWNYMGTVCALVAIPVLVIARYEFDDEFRPIYPPYGTDGLPPGAMPLPPSMDRPPPMYLPNGQQGPPSPQYTQQRRPPP